MTAPTYDHPIWRAAGPLAHETNLPRRKDFRLTAGLFLVWGAVALALNGVVAAAEAMTPLERVLSTPVGELKTPYPDFKVVADEGYKIYRSLDCGGCHGGGGGGGGGMAAPLTNPVWIYGNEDDTLFRLITLGTGPLSLNGAFPNQGFVRKGSELVVGPMPPYGNIIKSEDDLWKMIAWIRFINSDPRD